MADTNNNALPKKERQRLYARAYYEKHRDRIRSKASAYYKSHRSSCDARQRAYQIAHPDKVRMYARHTYSKRRDHYLEKSKNWQKANRDKIRAYNSNPIRRRIVREKLSANREHVRAWYRAWYKKHAAERNAYFRDWAKRSPKRKMIIIKWAKCGEICYICGGILQLNDITIDHVIPSSKGGPSTIDNLMPVHLICNMRKNGRIDFPFARPDLLGVSRG